MKTLLAVVNYPKQSKDFIEYVASMAIDLQEHVHLVYIEDSISYPLSTPGSSGAGVVQVKEHLKSVSKEVEATLKTLINRVEESVSEDLSISYSTHVGVIPSVIDGLIETKNVSMIVIEGQEDQSFWTQSSTNMEIIENTNCPVWVIPLNQKYEPFREIVYATDYVKEDIKTLKKLVYLTRNYLPSITALHITNNADFEEKLKQAGFHDKVKKETAYNNLDVKLLNKSKETSMPDLISDYASSNKANLIVVLKENRGFLKQLFTTSETEKIIKKSKVPVLVYQEEN